MSTPAKTETGGWFSRLFGATSTSTGESSSTERAEPVKSPVSPGLQKRVENAKNLIKHLSPPTNGSRPMPGKSLRTLTSPASIIQRTDTRKRQHINNGEPPVLEDIFKQRSFKRFCGTANLSLAEEPIRITVPERLDMTWAGDRVDASPASSVRSLKSRLSGAASTTSSGLSSKTRAILAQLEKVHTPAREAKKLPVMRHPTVTSERWNTASAIFNTSSSAGAPPLRKTRSAVPTRLQLLSTNLGFNKTPYWKDIYRPSMKERDEAAKQKETNGQSETADELNGSRLHPIFEIPNTIPRRTTDLGRQRASKIKGSDGISRNVFNTKDLDDEDEINALPVPKTVKMPTVTAPAKGFMGTLSFQFDMPKERMSPKSNGRPESSLSRSFEQQSSSSSERSDQEESGESSSESRESSPEPPKKEEPKSSFGFAAPPAKEPTVSVTVTAPTPTTKPADTWSCSECFVQSTGEQCICCGTPKGGVSVVAPQKELFSNLSSFAPKGNSVHSFGFGTSTTAPVATPTPDVPSTDSWDCPNCFVKATGDSCSCCDYSKTGQKKLTSKKLTKPISSEATSGFSFGVSATSAAEKPVEKPLTASSSSPNLFGSSKPVEVTSTSTFGAPAKTDSASWSCSVCFVNSTGDSCVACGTPKDGGSSAAAPQKELVSNLSSFAPVAPVKFGFGLGSSTTPAVEKTAEPVKKVETVPATSTTPSLNGASSIFGASTAVPEPTKPLFGASSEAAKSLFGHTPLFGSTAAETKTAEAPKITFGAPATTEAAKPLFGDSSKPLFGASAPLDSSKPLFGQTDSTKPLFGTSTPLDTSKPLFGASVAAPPAVPPAKPLFSSSTAPGSIFGTTTPAAPASTTTAAPAAPSLFPGFNATPAVPAVPTFGAPAVSAFGSQEAPAAKKPMFPSLAPAADAAKSATSVGSIFGQSGGNLFGQTPSAPAATGSSTNLFSQTPAPSAAPFTFGAPAAAPSFSMGGSALTGSASAGHLFTAPPAETPSSFNFGAAAAPGGQQPFVFGAPAAAAPTFSLGSSFGTAPVPASDGGMFAYSATSGGPSTSAAGRKIAQARRRIPGRK